MDRDILIGPTAGNHIVTELLDETIVIYAQDGCLHCKTSEKILVDNKPFSPMNALAIGKQIRVGRLSLVLTKVK